MSSYNLTEVKEMAGGDEDFLKMVVQTFLEEIPPDVTSMNEAVESENRSLAYQYAHKMKPNFQLFGLDLMPQIKIIEAWSKENTNGDDVPAAVAIITNKVTAAASALKRDFDL